MCYDLYAMAHWPAKTAEEARKIDDVVEFLSDEQFQQIPHKAYFWDGIGNGCLAMGQCVMACLSEARKVLFMELAARFDACRQQTWFGKSLAELKGCSTRIGNLPLPKQVAQGNT